VPVESVTSVTARNKFSTLLNRVGFGRERIVITRRDRKIAAIVPMRDLERIMELELPALTEEDMARAMETEVRRAAGCM
jgi:prevent-host-death family protein